MKPRIVVSGVCLTAMGAYMVFKDALESLASEHADRYDIVALVHRKNLFDVPCVTYLEFPEIKSSWLKRLRFEYYDCRDISKKLKPHLWFAMHDITPNVQANVRAVYCHNPSPFYKFSLKEAPLAWKFSLFTLLYRFLYGLNIKSNDFVIVQQDWLRNEFMSRYGVGNVVVAHPSVDFVPDGNATVSRLSKPFLFFYPAYPWAPYKNIEQILKAARVLERGGLSNFEIWLTMNGEETPYSKKMRKVYSDLATVRWLGIRPRTEVMRLYSEADCLLFPSKLETWGMPITEFKATGKPILAADLPYAHETVGQYERAAFFDTKSEAQLVAMMKHAICGEPIFRSTAEKKIAPPFSRNWTELWQILLGSREVESHMSKM